MKIDNIDLTQQFSLSILTDFLYQLIKITFRLLPIFNRYRFLLIDYTAGSFRYSSTTIWTMQNGLTEELRSATRKNEFISLHWLMNTLRHRLESWRFKQKQNNANLFNKSFVRYFWEEEGKLINCVLPGKNRPQNTKWIFEGQKLQM